MYRLRAKTVPHQAELLEPIQKFRERLKFHKPMNYLDASIREIKFKETNSKFQKPSQGFGTKFQKSKNQVSGN